MKDFLGNELNIGDKVVFLQHYGTSSSLMKGRVERMTEKSCFISTVIGDNRRKDPDKIVKIMGQKEEHEEHGSMCGKMLECCFCKCPVYRD